MSDRTQYAQARIESLLARNKDYSNTSVPPRKFLDAHNDPNLPPGVLILTCTDPRVIPEKFFNFERGVFPVVRNAGGRAFDALRSIAVLDRAVGVYAVLVVHHRDCGLSHMSNSEIRDGLKERDPEHAAEIDATEFGEIVGKDFEGTLKEDVEVIKSSKWFRKDLIVKGLLLDLETGRVSEEVS